MDESTKPLRETTVQAVSTVKPMTSFVALTTILNETESSYDVSLRPNTTVFTFNDSTSIGGFMTTKNREVTQEVITYGPCRNSAVFAGPNMVTLSVTLAYFLKNSFRCKR